MILSALVARSSDPVAAAASGAAVARLVVQNFKQLLGYAETFWAVPPEWCPTNRVLLATRSDAELILDDESNLIDAKGEWNRHPVRLEPTGRYQSRNVGPVLLPDTIRDLLDCLGADAWLGVTTSQGIGVLPCTWLRGVGAILPHVAAAHMAPSLPGEVCLTMAASDGRRPGHKRGVMLRGLGTIVERSERDLVVALQPTRVTYWTGFDSGTVSLV